MEEGLRRHIRLSDYATIAQAELIGIEECAKYCINKKVRGRTIVIHCDSQAALKSLKRKDTISRTVSQVHRSLNRIAEENRVILYWCPGHEGIMGNEIADELANLGIENAAIDINVRIPMSHIRAAIDDKTKKEFQKHWESYPGVRFSKIMMPNLDGKRAFALTKMNRRTLRIAIGILTGTCCFKWFLSKIKKTRDDLCRFCETSEEKMEHILTECDPISTKRYIETNNYYVETERLNEVNIHDWIKFLKSTGMAKTFFRQEE